MRHLIVEKAEESGEHGWYVHYVCGDERENKMCGKENAERSRRFKKLYRTIWRTGVDLCAGSRLNVERARVELQMCVWMQRNL
jgi:hypothetical protein